MTIAYFSMEVALDSAMPTYSGGLGVLAGDTLKAAADLGLPMMGVTLLHRQGYFRQHLDAVGHQSETPASWDPEMFLEPVAPRVRVDIEGRPVEIRIWRHVIRGVNGHEVTVYFLDTALAENDPRDQALTGRLYGGDVRYRLAQEVVLGLGGVALLDAMRADVRVHHMNEGHAALLALALLERQAAGRPLTDLAEEDRKAVRGRCVFTTHTPVPAGHDRFPRDLVGSVLGEARTAGLEANGCFRDGELNMTFLGMLFSHYINGVSMRHEEISQGMFPQYPIASITNGVHAVTWASPPMQELFDRHIPQWRRDNLYLRYAINIVLEEVQHAHAAAKHRLVEEIARRTGRRIDPGVLTIGFARRSTAYKRPGLLLADLDRLRRIARVAGRFQVIYAGKAHPNDDGGKEEIRRVVQAAAALGDEVPVVYLEEYDLTLAGVLCAGADLWLNTPQKPLEASGTSGMKAALNGVPSLSVPDGWWIEGLVEGVTGWAIGESGGGSDPAREIASLYHKLEHVIIPLFYSAPAAYAQVQRSAIALNGSFFNAQRMVSQYLENSYRHLEHQQQNAPRDLSLGTASLENVADGTLRET